ncbi:MAG: sigma-70 family RNA polymerase sigma factor [Myxococcales bacterium]|nr:sigma-70 family RNA polymerase sigma factor [Myxococcales bacterium]
MSTPGGQAPDRVTERAELQSNVRAAIESLATNQRIVVILHYLANMSLQDIADVLGCPVGTVMSRLFRGRRILQKALYDYAVSQGIVSAPAEGGAVSLEDYRARKKQAKSSGGA